MFTKVGKVGKVAIREGRKKMEGVIINKLRTAPKSLPGGSPGVNTHTPLARDPLRIQNNIEYLHSLNKKCLSNHSSNLKEAKMNIPFNFFNKGGVHTKTGTEEKMDVKDGSDITHVYEEMNRMEEMKRMAEEEVCISDGRMILVDNLLKVDTKTNTNEESKNQKEILEAFDDISKFETKTPEEQGEAINRIFEKFNKKIFEYLSRLEDFFENFKKKNNSFFEKVTNGGGGGGGGGNDMSSKIDMILTLLSLLISFLEGEEKKEEKEKNKLLAKKKDAERRKNEFEKRLDDVEAKLKKIGSELGELRKIKNKSEDKSKKDILSKIESLENEEETLTIEKEDIGKSIEMVKDEILKLEKDIKICDGNLDDLKEKIKLLKSVRFITIPIVSLNNFIFSKNVNKFLSRLSGSLSTLFLWGSDLAHLYENEALSSGLGHLSTGTSIIANISGKSIEGLAVDSVGVILENRDLESVEEVKDRVSQSVEEVKDGVSRSVEEVKDRVSRYVDSKDEDD